MSTISTPVSSSPVPAPLPVSEARYAIPPRAVRRFTVDEYHQLIEQGYFSSDERFELLEGWIVAKMSRNPIHDAAVDLVEQILRRVLGDGWYVRGQKAFTTADSEPEPDVAVVRGSPRDYAARHPGPADAALIVEVANSTLADDREIKGRLYARAGVQEYWIVNLVDRVVEVYRLPATVSGVPTFTQRAVFSIDQTLTFSVSEAVVGPIRVADLMP